MTYLGLTLFPCVLPAVVRSRPRTAWESAQAGVRTSTTLSHTPHTHIPNTHTHTPTHNPTNPTHPNPTPPLTQHTHTHSLTLYPSTHAHTHARVSVHKNTRKTHRGGDE